MSKNYRYATRSYFTKKMLKKSKKIRPHCAKCKKNASALRQMPKYAAHAEESKKCGIFVRRSIAFFPQGVFNCDAMFIYKVTNLNATQLGCRFTVESN